MRDRCSRIPASENARWDGARDDAPGADNRALADRDVWQYDDARPDIDIILDPDGGLVGRSRMGREITKVSDDDRADADRDVVPDRYQIRIRGLDQHGQPNRHIVTDGDSAHAVQPDARGLESWRVEREDLQQPVLQAD